MSIGKRDVVAFGQGYVGLVDEIFKSQLDGIYLARVIVFVRPDFGAYKVGSLQLFLVSELKRHGNLDHEPELAGLLVD